MAYSWFSPVKGVHPGLVQGDLSRLLAEDSGFVDRGSIMALTPAGEFTLAASAEDAGGALFAALQMERDAQAGMAGTTGFETGGRPKITGLSLRMSGEYETSNFDFGQRRGGDQEAEQPKIGDLLSVRDGMLVKADDESEAMAVLTAVPKYRWVNDHPSKYGFPPAAGAMPKVVRQGASVKVIRFRCIERAAGGGPLFTYNVGTDGSLELDFGPSMANQKIGISIEEA